MFVHQEEAFLHIQHFLGKILTHGRLRFDSEFLDGDFRYTSGRSAGWRVGPLTKASTLS